MVRSLAIEFDLPPKRNREHTFSLLKLLHTAILLAVLGIYSTPAEAQSASLLLGNPQIPLGLAAQGYAVTHSVSQTPTETTITYTVTAPSSGFPTTPVKVGQINLLSVLPAGSLPVPVMVSATYSGPIYIQGSGSNIAPFTLGSANNMQSLSSYLGAGVSTLVFNVGNGSSATATLTLSINVGNPTGERKPYLNDFTGAGGNYGAGSTDYTVWRPSEGNWYVDLNTGSAPNVIQQWGSPGDVPLPGDYDGDGISDYAVWRPSEGIWYVILSSTGQQVITPWGLPGDIPIGGGDYDGDGKTDYAIWRPSDLKFYVLYSSDGQQVQVQWGLPGDIPLAGNFDGDSKTDFVVWRPSEGIWYVVLSSNGLQLITPWGLPGDIPVPGDYDGDGKTDYAVWRPLEGTWYVTYSSTGQQVTVPWGLPGDIPIPGDYYGTGKNDYAIWRPSTWQFWVVDGLGGAETERQWGLEGDFPIGQILTSPPPY